MTEPTNEPYYIEHSFTKDKYQLIQEKEEHQPAAKNEIYITNDGRPNKFYAYGTEYLLKNKDQEIRLKATGKAISKAFLVAELIKKRVPGIHQQTTVDTTDSIARYEPLEEGLDVVSVIKKLSVIEIILSYKALDTTHYGYQSPLEANEVTEITLDDLLKKKQPRRNEKNNRNDRNDRKGDENNEEDDEEEGGRQNRGRGFQHRGNQRGGYRRGGRGGRRGGFNRRPRSLSDSNYHRRGGDYIGNRFQRGGRSGRRGGYAGGVSREEKEDMGGEKVYVHRGRGGFGGDRGDRGDRVWRSRGHVNRGGYQEHREEDDDREKKTYVSRGEIRGYRRGGRRGGDGGDGEERRHHYKSKDDHDLYRVQKSRGFGRGRRGGRRGGFRKESNGEEPRRGGYRNEGEQKRGGYRNEGNEEGKSYYNTQFNK